MDHGGGAAANSGDSPWRARWATMLGPGIVVALTLVGHELLFLILPLHAAAFGLSLAWVGVVLASNRLIRVIGYGWVVALGRRLGPRDLMVAAATASAVATFAYALVDGGPALLATRLVWGLAFAALNIASLVYAVGDLSRAGTRVGVSRSISSFGPGLAFAVGGVAVLSLGPRDVFLIAGLFAALAVPMALSLPPLPSVTESGPKQGRLRPDRMDLFYFAIGLAIDGLFGMTLALFLAERTTVETALVVTGLLLAMRHFVAFAVTPLGGWIGDRFGAERAQQGFGILTVLGFGAIAAGSPFGGAVAIVVARAALSALGPVAVARRHGPGAMTALSRQATWLDFGAAVGPLVTGALLQVASLPQLYAAAAVIVLAALVFMLPGDPAVRPTASSR